MCWIHGSSLPPRASTSTAALQSQMRDGTILRADIYRPETSGCYPVLVERVPYELLSRAGQEGDYFASRGYVYVAQNVRGTFASEGIFRFLDDDGWGLIRDGYDTIEWANSQPWSNRSVATVGGSYSGYTQYAVAPTRPPHLRTMVVREGPSDIYRDVFTRGGAHQLGLMRDWILRAFLLPQLRSQSAPAGWALRALLEKAEEDIESWYWHLPLKSFAPAESVADWYFEQLAHPGRRALLVGAQCRAEAGSDECPDPARWGLARHLRRQHASLFSGCARARGQRGGPKWSAACDWSLDPRSE